MTVKQISATCDFPSISNPLDDAVRTCFMCAVGNEGVLRAIFRKNADVTFTEAVAIASEVEEATKTAKAQLHSRSSDVNLINKQRSPQTHQNNRFQKRSSNKSASSTGSPSTSSSNVSSKNNRVCDSCGGTDHPRKDCRFLKSKCHFCEKVGISMQSQETFNKCELSFKYCTRTQRGVCITFCRGYNGVQIVPFHS